MKTHGLFFLVTLMAFSSPAFAKDAPARKEQDLGFSLNPEIVRRIVAPKHISRIVSVHGIGSFVPSFVSSDGKEEGYVVISIDLSLEGAFRFESMWHGNILLARKLNADWRSAVEFSLPPTFTFKHLSTLSLSEFEEFLKEHKKPNQL